MSKSILIYILLLSAVESSYGQVFHRKEGQKRLVILSPGFSMQGGGNYYTELNLMFAKCDLEQECVPSPHWGPRLGMETNFSKDHFVYAPKIGWEGSFLLFCARGNVISYIDKGNVDLRILPELGISCFSLINLTYGYNIPVLEYRTTAITNHRLTLTINIDRDLF